MLRLNVFFSCISSGIWSDFLNLISFQSVPDWTESEPRRDDTLIFQLLCLHFSLCRWEKRKELPAPAISQPSAINHEPQHGWFMMLLALVACSNMAWLKSPYILVFHPLGVDLAFPSSLVASFSDLHLSFQSRFPRLSLSPLPFPFFTCPVRASENEKSHVLYHDCIYKLKKSMNI